MGLLSLLIFTDEINYGLLFIALSQQGNKIKILIENYCGFGVAMSSV